MLAGKGLTGKKRERERMYVCKCVCVEEEKEELDQSTITRSNCVREKSTDLESLKFQKNFVVCLIKF
jgi:hypothetical protein